MVEFLIVIPLLLLLVFGALQFAFIYHAKITLNYATFEAARAGSLNNAKMVPMERAFARGLAPLFTHSKGQTEVIRAKNQIKDEITAGYVRIRLINPSPESFLDHGVDLNGERVIPNDNLMYRDASISGGASKQSIQDANLLKIHVGYCYELFVPFVNRLLVRMMSLAPTALEPENIGPPEAGSFAASCVLNPQDAGRMGFPIYSQAIIRMQSAATLATIP